MFSLISKTVGKAYKASKKLIKKQSNSVLKETKAYKMINSLCKMQADVLPISKMNFIQLEIRFSSRQHLLVRRVKIRSMQVSTFSASTVLIMLTTVSNMMEKLVCASLLISHLMRLILLSLLMILQLFKIYEIIPNPENKSYFSFKIKKYFDV